jgi:chromosome segregation ATPase
MCRELATDENERQIFTRAALALHELRERIGLSAEELEEKVHGLQEEVSRLEPIVQELQNCNREMEELSMQKQSLTDEVAQLQERYKPLCQSVAEKEHREEELSRRILDLEQRAQAADERMAMARRELKTMTGLGLSPDDLPGFVGRIGMTAQRLGIDPSALRDRLLHELEEIGTGIGLESLVENRRHELNQIEQTVETTQRELDALDSTLQQLRQQHVSLHASIAEEKKHVHKEIRATANLAREAVVRLNRDLDSGVSKAIQEVEKLSNQAVEVGLEMGRYDAMIEGNKWLRTMVALIEGEDGLSAADVRLVGLALMRGVMEWLQQKESQTAPPPYWLISYLNSVIQGLEQWRV